MPDPVRISVSAIRREIYRASGFAAGEGQPSTDLLGSLFHKTFHALMDPEGDAGWANLLDPESLEDHARLREHAYALVVGPGLRENQAALQHSAAEALAMWEATGHLCKHICQLLSNSYRAKLLTYDAAAHTWANAAQFSWEEPVSWLVEDANWKAPVLVSGVVDAVWRNPASGRWCVLEVKLRAGSLEADLAQLCLYHEMLKAQAGADSGPLSLWHFQPALHHTQVSEEDIRPVKTKLRALIGRLAGVAGHGRAASAVSPTMAHRELGARLVQVLEQFGPMVSLDSDPIVGPAFLRFHVMPGPGVKVSKILPLGHDLAIQLRLSQPALIHQEGGTLLVDVQRPDRETLYFREFRHLLPTGEFGNAGMLVGVDLKRRPQYAALDSDSPHILAAGTTGSGKSEWLRMAVASLLATNQPETLRLMVIDPKRVTFGGLERSPFLLDNAALLFSPEEAIGGLHRLIDLMEERYSLFQQNGCADLRELRMRLGHAPPRIVCFCDEYGNLVGEKKNRVAIEQAINQLGAKARAAGIHLVLATQDPRATILSPALKTNLSGRVCLRTTSATQSRMVLEENGAESLLGHGDLFFKTAGQPVRLQAPLLQDAERVALFESGAREGALAGPPLQ